MARKSILVVDDEKSQREILEMILSGEGYDVTTASSGEAAMKFVADRHFDLVLSDLKMTGMSGLDLLKQLTDFDKFPCGIGGEDVWFCDRNREI